MEEKVEERKRWNKKWARLRDGRKSGVEKDIEEKNGGKEEMEEKSGERKRWKKKVVERKRWTKTLEMSKYVS